MFIPHKKWKEKQKEQDVQIPLPLELPLPVPFEHNPKRGEEKEETPRGVWTVDI